MTPEEMEERDIVEFTDEQGNTLLLEVMDYFFYNGEEMEEFVPPDEALMEKLIQVVRTRFVEDEDADEDDEEE